MNELVLISGIGVVAFLILFLGFKCMDKEHVFWRLLSVFFVLYLLTMVGKVAQDSGSYCQLYVANSTEISTNTTSFDYVERCFDEEETTHTMFFKLTQWIMRVFAAYIFIYYSYKAIKYLADRAREKKKG